MGSGLILPNTPEIREYCQRRDSEIAAARAEDPDAPSQIPKIEENAEYQRRKLMSVDEKFVDAVARSARARQIYWERVHGIYKSIEQCKAEMAHIYRKYGRDKGIE